MKKIGILGGTFDPVHRGHLAIAQAAARKLNLDYVYLMPANVSPFKVGRNTSSNKDRLSMLRLATKGCDFCRVSTIETDKGQISYTYETISKIKKEHPEKEIVFIVGADNLLSIEKWYKGKELLKSCSLAVGVRPGYDMTEVNRQIEHLTEVYGTRIDILDNIQLCISSTDIKERVRAGHRIEYLVTPEVERYIYAHGLYI